MRTERASTALLIACLLSPCLPAAELFGPASVSIRTGDAPRAIAIADFDGDGIPDMAVGNNGDDTVSIFLGDGLGGFTRMTQDIPVGDGPRAISVADFDGDGITDLAVANYSDDTISILLGTGDGRFDPPDRIVTGDYPSALASDDFNGDGAADLAVALRNDDAVGLLFGDGAGGFVPGTEDITVGVDPFSLAIGDFDGDGDSDLATANSGFNSTTISILLGDGDGGFARAPDDVIAGSRPISIVAADYDRDGDLDLAVAALDDDAVTLLLGDGAGGFAPAPDQVPVGDGPYAIAAGDLNGDGARDLAVTNLIDSTVSILLNDGAGGFARSPNIAIGAEMIGTGPRSIVIADLNRDGGADLAVGDYSDDSINILLGDGIGSLVRSPEIAAGSQPRAIAAGDFNNDTLPDLAVAAFDEDFIRILLGDGKRGFTPMAPVTVGDGPRSLAVSDFDGDGDGDLAVANLNGNTVSILTGDGEGGLEIVSVIGVGLDPNSVAAGEFNGDGITDLVVANGSEGQFESTVSILLGDGSGGFPQSLFIRVGGVDDLPSFVVAEDLDGDGDKDLAVSKSGRDEVAILLGDGSGAFTHISDAAVGSEPESIAAADFDRDGALDLAVANYGGSSLSLLMGDGSGGFTSAPPLAAADRPFALTAADFNADGAVDLAVSSFTLNFITLLLGDGDGGFRETAEAITVGPYPYSIAVADFNGDEVPDMGIAQQSATEAFSDGVGLLFNRLPQRADINGSNRVDGFDIAAVGRQFGLDSSDPAYRRGTDANLDGSIDGDDLNLVADRFGELNRLTSPLRISFDQPQPTAPGTITLQPLSSEGDLLTLQILVDDDGFAESHTADFVLSYYPLDYDRNPTQVLEALPSYEPGDYLSEGATPIYLVDTNEPGEVRVVASRLSEENRSGAGDFLLLRLFFRAKREGVAVLEFAPSSYAEPALLNYDEEIVPGVSFVGGASVSVDSTNEAFPGQRIGFAPEMLDFAAIDAGGISRLNLVVSNFGFAELEVAGVTTNLAEQFGTVPGSFTIPPLAFVEMPVSFSAAEAGLFSGHMEISSNDPRTPLLRVPVIGRSGLAVGLSPTRLDFGAVTVGGEKTLRLRLTNREDAQLVMTGITTSDAQFEPVAGFALLEPGQTGGIDLTFRPAGPGDYSALLTIGFDAPEEKSVVISLTGSGEAPK
jgi:hypothetical protein